MNNFFLIHLVVLVLFAFAVRPRSRGRRRSLVFCPLCRRRSGRRVRLFLSVRVLGSGFRLCVPRCPRCGSFAWACRFLGSRPR